jgi:hypothetical protein
MDPTLQTLSPSFRRQLLATNGEPCDRRVVRKRN